MRSNLHDITVIFQHQTELAVCIRETEDRPDVWFPKSEVEIEAADGDLRRGCVARLTAPERLLIEKGLI